MKLTNGTVDLDHFWNTNFRGADPPLLLSNWHLWEGVELTQPAHETFDSRLGTGLVCAAVQQGKTMN